MEHLTTAPGGAAGSLSAPARQALARLLAERPGAGDTAAPTPGAAPEPDRPANGRGADPIPTGEHPAGRPARATPPAGRAGTVAAELAQAGWTGPQGGLRPEAALLFGCDVGGTKTQSVLATLDGRVLAEIREQTDPAGGTAVLDQIARHWRELASEQGPVAAAGIGLPGTVHPRSGQLSRAPNLAGLAGQDMRTVLADRLGVPVAVENDVNLAALGEGWLGDGRGAGSFLFVALGTGIGMGALVEGTLLRGAHGAAGEIAALPIGADAFDPATFATGALESVVSTEALLADYRRLGGEGRGSLRELFRAQAPDPALARVMDRLAGRVALAVLAMTAVLDPERIIFGGGIGSRPELLARIRARTADCMDTPPDCRISALGNRAGVIGAIRAARLALASALEIRP
ncbi:ROK family protein (plasmid) [Paroceanicella profunda]|uniref:ROK family protein n=1 Tax=Paroceanicella profunda TaxID=2579971 RepID=A0A5B8FJJ4_9RHOB|nr:ROK family protein [Paroceanicella profunda]QDL94941.1 ROK family protein [Paroceanicella profunda]